jgi:DNA polymerase I
MRAIITNSYYSTDPLTIHWIGRKENGEKLFLSFPSPIKPYFFAQKDDKIIKVEIDNPSQVKQEKDKYSKTWEADIIFSERVLIDMGFYKAMDIDTMKPCSSDGIKLRKFSLDIETDDSVPLDIKNPQGEILEIGFRDYYKNITFILTTIKKFDLNKFLDLKFEEDRKIKEALISKGLNNLIKNIKNLDIKIKQFENEKELLTYFHKLIHSNLYGDVNVGWYIGGKVIHPDSQIFGFDMPYIQKRGEKYGLNFNYDKLVINFDLRDAYMKLEENDLESFSLEFISQRELGIGKIKHEEGYKEMYLNNPEKFMVYHHRDMLLVQLIDLKREIFDFFQTLSEKVGSLDIGKWNSNYLIDSLMFHELHNTDLHVPSATVGIDKTKVEGGQVFLAVVGRFKNVVVLDNSSEYPSTIETFNLSHDTLTNLEDGDIKLPELGYGFTLKKEGFIPKAIKKLKNYRKSIKKEMEKYDKDSEEYKKMNNEQRAVKELTNAFYGTMGNAAKLENGYYRYSRLYNPEIQKAITYLAREHIKFIAGKIEQLNQGIEIKYGDTDSVMVYCKKWETLSYDEIIKEVQNLLVYINSTFPEFVQSYGGDPLKSTLEMKFEKIYSNWLQTGAKKNYTGRVVYKDGKYVTAYTEYRGMAPRRSDKSDYTKEFVTNLVEYSHDNLDKSWEYYITEEKRWNKKDKSLISKMGIYISLNQSTYSTNYQPQKAVNRAIKEGIKLDKNKGKYKMYFLTDGVIAINFDDVLPSKYTNKIDWESHKRRCFVLPAEGIVKIIKPYSKIDDFESDDKEEIVFTEKTPQSLGLFEVD